MMISKKSYSQQLLQLVLALSLMRVDPSGLWNDLGWETRLAGTSGGWQLEMSQTPITEYPYLNRKTYIPLIEDLARFDSITSHQDVHAYLLNVSNEKNPMSSNSSASTNNQTTNENSAAAQDELFLNSDHLNAGESILDQNLADLNDYEDIALPFLHSLVPLPTKTEVPDWFDDVVDLGLAEEPYGELEATSNGTEPARTSSIVIESRIINWSEYLANDTVQEGVQNLVQKVTVKKEVKEEPNDDEVVPENSLRAGELTREVSLDYVTFNSIINY